MPFSPLQEGKHHIQYSDTPGEVLSPAGLKSGEMAFNVADGKRYMRAAGGNLMTVSGSVSPQWETSNPEAWPAFQASMESTISTATLDPSPTTKSMPVDKLPAGYRITYGCPFGENEVLFMWWHPGVDNGTQGIIWNVETDETRLTAPLFENTRHAFGMAEFENGKILITTYQGGGKNWLYDPATDTAHTYDYLTPATWGQNGTFFWGNKREIAATPDAGIDSFAVYSQDGSYRLVSKNAPYGAHRAGQLMKNGHVYLFRGTSSYVRATLDPTTGVITYGDPVGYWADTGTLMPDGKVFLMPYSGNDTRVPGLYDPDTGVITPCPGGSIGPTGTAWYGAMLLPTGHVLIQHRVDATAYLYDVDTGIVRTDTLPAKSLAPFYAGSGWIVSHVAANDTPPPAYRTSSDSFSPEVTRSAYFGTWN